MPTTPMARPTLSKLELRCPPLPQTLVEAMDLIDRPEQLEVGPVTEMVQRDPVVVARLLHVVNSAYYGLRHTVSSAERAVVLLGPVAVAGIVVGMNMLKLRGAMTEATLQCFTKLSRHCLATAFLTRHLLEGPPRERTPHARRSPARVGVSFTAGLLHDFGKIILVYNFPDEAVRFFGEDALQQQVAGADRLELEQLLFGYDHTEAGAFVARKMNFPDLLTAVIHHHHDDPDAPDDAASPEAARLIRAVRAADLAAKAFGFGFEFDLSWETCAEAPIWDRLARLDLPHHGSTNALLDNVAQQRDHLAAYVEGMMTPREPSPSTLLS